MSLVSGALLFASNAVRYIKNDDFQIKIFLILLAFLNMCAFQYLTKKRMNLDEDHIRLSMGTRLAGGISLALWIAAVFFGRRIGFTLAPF